MFNLFFKKKSRSQLNDWEVDLMLNTFKLLGRDYEKFEEQITRGIIKSVRLYKQFPDYLSFGLNVKLLNEYEKKLENYFEIGGLSVFDITSKSFIPFSVECDNGLIFGYTMLTPKNFMPDLNKINVTNQIKILKGEDEFNKIKHIFTNEEISKINKSDVYEVILDNKTYYHIKDFEDGDFLGIDINKNIYIINHDPYEVILQKNSFLSYL
ncbi:hypothetical protein [Flavobacterium restrictum]|uniref:Uncharacterized protein n=1 Tax=Flavobacterium restrictum TaxID=2594428 RepID=A0A553DRM6_9FLAO|nr:hypothetical protein [Flavobacterium restrictum]TRX35407.1 hypothetical protein FNW21_15225 [Flavobacterium restrictum]